MIYELLAEGSENARTGRELAILLNVNIRDITEQIERERRQGLPICAATTGDHPGYFIPANADELQTYCNKLKSRAIEVFKTRQALIKVLKQLQEKRGAEHGKTTGN